MQFLLDLLPVIVFFVVFKVTGMFPEIAADQFQALMIATAALIVVTVTQSAWLWVRHRKVSRMQLITAGLVLVFGGLTLYLQDDLFIKLKPSMVYLLFAAAFLGSDLLTEQPVIRRMMENVVQMREERLWSVLNTAWVVFFIALAALNIWVASNWYYDHELWVDFKLFGLMGLTLIFVIAQAIWLTRHAIPIEEDGEDGTEDESA
jgi:intracellular septation protein